MAADGVDEEENKDGEDKKPPHHYIFHRYVCYVCIPPLFIPPLGKKSANEVAADGVDEEENKNGETIIHP